MGTISDAAELLFGRYRRQVLSLLLLRPEETFYLRELERLSGMRPGPLHRELTSLAGVGLVRRVSQGNQVLYQANKGAPLFDELAAIFRKAAGATAQGVGTREPEAQYRPALPAHRQARDEAASGLKRLSTSRREVATLCKKWGIGRMWLFGSVTREDFGPDSDVDVLVDFPCGGAPSLFGIVHLRDELSTLFGGRRVDVMTPAILRNPIRKKAIEKDMQVVYDAS